MKHEIQWEDAQRICDLPSIDEMISALVHDATNDNAVCLVREILKQGCATSKEASEAAQCGYESAGACLDGCDGKPCKRELDASAPAHADLPPAEPILEIAKKFDRLWSHIEIGAVQRCTFLDFCDEYRRYLAAQPAPARDDVLEALYASIIKLQPEVHRHIEYKKGHDAATIAAAELVDALQSHPAPEAAPMPAQVICGESSTPPDADLVGCGKPIASQNEAYRCTDCGVPFHRDCATKHFDEDTPETAAKKFEERLRRIDAAEVGKAGKQEPAIVNTSELDAWLFEHAVIQGHKCDAVKRHDGLNAAWVDTTTTDRIDIRYGAAPVQPASSQAQAVTLTDGEILDTAHRMAWRYKHSSDPHHSHTYTFNVPLMIGFVRRLLGSAKTGDAG